MKGFKVRLAAFLSLAVLLTFVLYALLGGGLMRNVVEACVEVQAAKPFEMQLFYSRTLSEPLQASDGHMVLKGRSKVWFELPIDEIRRFRMDFGSSPGVVSIEKVVLCGEQDVVLPLEKFANPHDISDYSFGENGLMVVSSGKDPYLHYRGELAVRGDRQFYINYFALLIAVIFALMGAYLFVVMLSSSDVVVGFFGREDVAFAALCFVLICGRLALTSRLPAVFFLHASWDDAWMVKEAMLLANGHWLGTYDHHTLIKGCFAPMVLAVCKMIGVSFLSFSTWLHVVVCGLFVGLISRICRNKVLLLAILALLLFNPLSFAYGTWQRIYRNGMSVWQVPLLFGAFFAIVRYNRHSLWALSGVSSICGFLLWMMENTREDALWTYPFVTGAIAISVYGLFRGGRASHISVRCFLLVCPLLILLVGNGAVAALNRLNYGCWMRNDRNSGNYARVMKDLYSIKPDPADEIRYSQPMCGKHYHNVYLSTVERALQVSPTFKQVQSPVCEAIKTWGKMLDNGGVEHDPWYDHVLFAIRNGVYTAGYYHSLPESEQFYGKVHEELQEAFSRGDLSRRGLILSAMAAPLQPKHTLPILQSLGRNFSAVVSFYGITASNRQFPSVLKSRIPTWERITGETYLDDKRMSSVEEAVGVLNGISNAYHHFSAPLFILACLSFAVMLGVRCRGRGRDAIAWGHVLFAFGILASMLLQIAMLSYIDATTFPVGYAYRCPAHVLCLMFCCVVLAMVVRALSVVLERCDAK